MGHAMYSPYTLGDLKTWYTSKSVMHGQCDAKLVMPKYHLGQYQITPRDDIGTPHTRSNLPII